MRHSWLYGCLDDVGGARDNRGRYETSGGARPNGVATLGRAPNVSDMESTSPVEPAGKAGAVSAGASTTGVAWARQNTQSCPTGTFVWECGRTAPIPTATNAARRPTRRTFCHPAGFMGGSFYDQPHTHVKFESHRFDPRSGTRFRVRRSCFPSVCSSPYTHTARATTRA